MKLTRIPILLFIACLATIGGACSAPPQPTSSRGIEPRREYELTGKVVSVDKTAKRVTVEHKEIPGYMEAMTMGFALRDPSYFDILQPGDDLSATLVVEDGKSYLDQITSQRQTPIGDATPNAPRDLGRPGEPQIGAPVSDFRLVSQDGKELSLAGQSGRAVLLTFIYTRCPLPDYCPLMTQNFAEVARLLDEVKVPADKVSLLSVSIDPEHDSPQVLREYRDRLVTDKSSRERLTFATGAPEEIRKVANFFGLLYSPGAGDTIDHSLRTALIAPDGKLVKLYRGNEWKPAEVASDLRALSNGVASSQPGG